MMNTIDPNVPPSTLSSEPAKARKKREPVSITQKELMFEFMTENPQLITHSSTKECELELWTELAKKLNALQPSKSSEFWRTFWKRWLSNVASKTESSLTILDSKLKKFLANLGIENYGDENKENRKSSNKNIFNIQEISSRLKNLDAEKAKLTLEIDNMDCKIVQYKTSLKELSRVVQEKRKRVKEISTKKKDLCEKRRKIEQEESKETSSNDSEE